MVMVFSFATFTPNVPKVNAEESIYKGGPFDLAIANDEKLIEMLKANGTIAPNATPVDAERAVKQYLKEKAANAEKAELIAKDYELPSENTVDSSILNSMGNKMGNGQYSLMRSFGAFGWNGEVRKDKILVLLIDFPDYPHNSITPEETDMYYPQYTKEHYAEMLFGANGYTGPNGENLVSMRQFYEEQSGGSYTIEGTITDWYTASQPAAYYGGNYPDADGNDIRPRNLVYEALMAVAADQNINLGEFDQEDRYDLDGDGDLREPDGLIDHLMVIHAGVGEEAGGGALGTDAIWSHRWNLGGVVKLPGSTAEVPYWGGNMAAYDYTIQPEDGAAGVFSHEYGHDLGLPDEYDTIYSGVGEPVAYWSIMSSGSWAGKIGGTEPTGFSPWAKEFFQKSMGGNWQHGITIHDSEITEKGIEVVLDQAAIKGPNEDVVKIQLPEKQKHINTPASGKYEYFSGSGNDIDNSMYTFVDLTDKTSAVLNFKTWYQIEADWDYASVQVSEDGAHWTTLPGNITTTSDPYEQNPGNGITGFSNGWVDAQFDLSAYAGKSIYLLFNYWTDGYVSEPGFYVDDIVVTADGTAIVTDNADDSFAFTLNGFEISDGFAYLDHYYLVEYRSHAGVDQGLGHIKRGNSLMSYDPGMVVWYYDGQYDNNWTGIHPGEGYLGVVDADQNIITWNNKQYGSTRYQVHDAAFGTTSTEPMYLDYRELLGMIMRDNNTARSAIFDDSKNYKGSRIPDAGRNIPCYGIKIKVLEESADRSTARILIYR
ncbi:MAG: immune inhibitor A domain-containing protein [Bacillota bacterium]